MMMSEMGRIARHLNLQPQNNNVRLIQALGNNVTDDGVWEWETWDGSETEGE